jgi:pimeloyl-ACP methyl ester carboxylesterase
MKMREQAFRTSAGLTLNVADSETSGPPVVFLHGVTRRWQDFLTLVPMFTSRWHVHALDFRGHGRSSRTPGAYRVSDYLADTAALLQAHFDEPAVVYGHSLGALVGIALAAQAPAAVRSLVLEDPPSASLVPRIRDTPFHAMFAGMHRLAGDRRPVRETARDLAEVRIPTGEGGVIRMGDLRDPTSLRFTARSLQDLDPEVFTPLLEGRLLDGCDLQSLCARVACPTLLLRADDAAGGMLSRRHAEQMAAAMADCTLLDLPGVGHLIHWLKNETTLRLTAGFLESL